MLRGGTSSWQGTRTNHTPLRQLKRHRRALTSFCGPHDRFFCLRRGFGCFCGPTRYTAVGAGSGRLGSGGTMRPIAGAPASARRNSLDSGALALLQPSKDNPVGRRRGSQVELGVATITPRTLACHLLDVGVMKHEEWKMEESDADHFDVLRNHHPDVLRTGRAQSSALPYLLQ